ncbi:hypothetical protein ACNKHX_14355 [Shigella flexneri]
MDRRSSSPARQARHQRGAINKLLTKESGLPGLTEVTSDCRYVEDNYATKKMPSARWTFTATAWPSTSAPTPPPWMVVWTLLYSLVVSVIMPRWFVNCLWANWACWALKLIMNATWLPFRQISFHQQRRYRPAVVIQRTKKRLSRKT